MADLEEAPQKEIPLVFARHRSLTCIPASVAQTHRVNTWFVSHRCNRV
jgi:hypothetical protein